MPSNVASESESDAFLDKHLPGLSPAMVRLRAYVLLLNSTRNIDLIRMILIRGETGAGKNHLAKIIAAHRKWRSARGKGDPGLELDEFLDRYSVINVPSLPEKLVEGELFGHFKGAFTGADRDKAGLLAGDGVDDLLLDEIGDISTELQTKLLGVLEDGTFRRLGGKIDDQEDVNARLLLATNRPLEELVRSGTFREDFYYRMRLFVIGVPPLRDQPENIPAIARNIEETVQKRRPVGPDATDPRLTSTDLEWAQHYRWPGNVRELKHAIIRWVSHDGRRSFSEIVEEMRSDEPQPIVSSSDAVLALVMTRIAAVIRGEVAPINQISDLPKEIEKGAKQAMAAWYQSAKPTNELLKRIFPGHTSIDSIRNKLAEWKKP